MSRQSRTEEQQAQAFWTALELFAKRKDIKRLSIANDFTQLVIERSAGNERKIGFDVSAEGFEYEPEEEDEEEEEKEICKKRKKKRAR